MLKSKLYTLKRESENEFKTQFPIRIARALVSNKLKRSEIKTV